MYKYAEYASYVFWQKNDELNWKSVDGLIRKAVQEAKVSLVIIDHLHYFTRELDNVAEDLGRITKEFKKKLDDLVEFLIPQYINEEKSQLVIAVGCTGGMHRSVYIANHLYNLLNEKGYVANLEHRDLMKNEVREHRAN